MTDEKPRAHSDKDEKTLHTAPNEVAPTKEHTKCNTKDQTEKEIGGFESAGLKEPTRYGDWEVNSRCSDF